MSSNIIRMCFGLLVRQFDIAPPHSLAHPCSDSDPYAPHLEVWKSVQKKRALNQPHTHTPRATTDNNLPFILNKCLARRNLLSGNSERQPTQFLVNSTIL
jgi:hypothetical protein